MEGNSMTAAKHETGHVVFVLTLLSNVTVDTHLKVGFLC